MVKFEAIGMETAILFIAIAVLVVVGVAIKVVPQQQAWIVERLGKYYKTLDPGLNFIIPFIDKVAYKHTLKERAIDVHEQTAITKDNVSLILDGVIYVRVINPVDASYGIENPYYGVTQLAQTTMRSVIGKMIMDKTFEEREALNSYIVEAINEAASSWGIQCMRYEIRDIKPPHNVIKAMEMQVAAERQKRADILESEGKMQSQINLAEAHKKEVVLDSEAAMQNKINRAKGEAEAIVKVAQATAQGIETVASSIKIQGSSEAINLKIAEKYVDAFKEFAKETNTLILPANMQETGSMIAQALTIFNDVSKKNNN